MRTKGSYNCAEVSLADLVGKFNPEAKIIVSRKFAQANGIAHVAVSANPVNIAANTPIQMSEPTEATAPIVATQAEVFEPVSVTEVV